MSEYTYEPQQTETSGEFTLHDFIRVARRRKWYIIDAVLVAVILSMALSLASTPMYSASADVLVEASLNSNSLGNTDLVASDRVMQNELARASGSEMQQLVRKDVGSEPILSVSLSPSSKNADILVFSSNSSSAERAAAAANAYAQTYIDSRRKVLTDSLDAQANAVNERLRLAQEALASYDGTDAVDLLQLRQTVDDYQSRLESIQTSRGLVETSAGSIIDAAQRPSEPFKPKPIRSAVLAVIVGLMLGFGAAFAREYFDQSVRDEEDLTRATDLQVMAVIPHAPAGSEAEKGVISLHQRASPQAEAYRVLRTSLQFRRVDGRIKVIQVTSAKSGEGKTTTAANLAVTNATAGQRTLLIDADLRRPRVHKMFNTSNRAGLSTILKGEPVGDIVLRSKQLENLYVLPSGPLPTDPAELLAGRELSKLLVELSEDYELIIVDTPPVLAVADGLIVANDVEGVIFVTGANETDRDEVSAAVRHLRDVGAPMIGAVLNNFEATSGSKFDYRYSYGEYAKSE